MTNKLDGNIFNQKLKLGDENYTIGDLFGVNPDEISQEFATQAARLAYLGMLLAKAEVAYDEAKALREEEYADVYLTRRSDLEFKGEKYTEAKLSAMVKLDDGYVNITAEENAALYNYKMMRAIVDAMRQRGDMLISLGATLRQEYDVTDMAILELKQKLVEAKDASRSG